jgi:AcrR family transcriptional regulator
MKHTRTNLSDADTRREAIVEAALVAFADAGFQATPVTAVAAVAEISQAYVFKLFPTKEELFVAAVERCFTRIEAVLEATAQTVVNGTPDEILYAMGDGYAALIADRKMLMIQVHAQSASDVPAIREVLRTGLKRIVSYVKQRTGASDEAVQRFIAFGQLCHLITTADIYDLGEDWARLLAHNIRHAPAL